jgi:hypothetical protein
VTVASFWHKCACLAGDVSSTTLQPYEKPPKKLRSVEMLLNNFPMRIIILPFLHPFPLSSLTCFPFPPSLLPSHHISSLPLCLSTSNGKKSTMTW